MTEHDSPPVDPLALQSAVEDLSDTWFVQGIVAVLEVLGYAMGQRASLGSLIGKLGGSSESLDDHRLGVTYFLTRLNGSRKACVFAALSAEAYINRLLYNRLDRRDADTAVRMRPVAERFAIGTHLALGATLFPRDDSLFRDLVELFKLRNKLVHAEPAEPIEADVLGKRAFEVCNPRIAHAHLLTTARTAQRMRMPGSSWNFDGGLRVDGQTVTSSATS